MKSYFQKIRRFIGFLNKHLSRESSPRAKPGEYNDSIAKRLFSSLENILTFQCCFKNQQDILLPPASFINAFV